MVTRTTSWFALVLVTPYISSSSWEKLVSGNAFHLNHLANGFIFPLKMRGYSYRSLPDTA